MAQRIQSLQNFLQVMREITFFNKTLPPGCTGHGQLKCLKKNFRNLNIFLFNRNLEGRCNLSTKTPLFIAFRIVDHGLHGAPFFMNKGFKNRSFYNGLYCQTFCIGLG